MSLDWQPSLKQCMDKIKIKNKKSMSVFILIPNIEGKSVLCYSKLQLEHCLGETLNYKMTNMSLSLNQQKI